MTMAAFCARALAAAVALLLIVFSALSVASETSRFADPCVLWGAQAEHQVSIGPADLCQSLSGISETKLGVVRRSDTGPTERSNVPPQPSSRACCDDGYARG